MSLRRWIRYRLARRRRRIRVPQRYWHLAEVWIDRVQWHDRVGNLDHAIGLTKRHLRDALRAGEWRDAAETAKILAGLQRLAALDRLREALETTVGA